MGTFSESAPVVSLVFNEKSKGILKERVRSEEKPVPVKPVRNTYKLLAITFMVVACLVIIVVIILAVYLSRQVTFTEESVERTFQQCGDCTGCLTCLSPYSDMDLVSECKEYSNTFQCSAQIIYWFGRKNYNQPCYSECSECQACLQQTPFSSLAQAEQLTWEYLFGNLFQDVKKRAALAEEKPRRAALGACCETSTTPLPYLDTYTDDSGTIWYPVWFNIPWLDSPYRYQWYNNATCSYPEPSCDETLTCVLETLSYTFLMTTKSPSATYGYTYMMLLLPSKTTEFANIPLPSYCQCTN